MHLSGGIAGSTVSAMATVVTAAAVNAAAAAAAAAKRIRKPAEDDGAGGVDEGKSEGDGEGDAEGDAEGDDDDDSASAGGGRAAAGEDEGGLELNEVVHALCLLVCVCDYLCASVNCVMHHHRATQGGDGNDAPDHVEVPPHNLL